MSVPITPGTGATSVASEAIAGLQYQQVKIVDGTAASTTPLKIIADGTMPVTVPGSVSTVIVGGSIVSVGTANQSVSGTVGASIVGQLPAGTAPIGSVAALQGTNPWVSTQVGSVITISQAPSIVGTYAEDAAHASADKGLFTLGVRNDTMSSVTSADGDYSPVSMGPIGEALVANAPLTKWVQGTADFRANTGASIVLVAAQGASVFTYITGIQIANMGPASVLVTLAGTGSTLGYSIAPAGGGSNIVYANALKTPANGTFAASISGVASVFVSAQGFISKT
jgi:hypothetical protein